MGDMTTSGTLKVKNTSPVSIGVLQEDLLEEQGEEEQDGAELPVAEERDRRRAGEPGISEQGELHERRSAPRPQLDEDEDGEEHDADHDPAHHLGDDQPACAPCCSPKISGTNPNVRVAKPSQSMPPV